MRKIFFKVFEKLFVTFQKHCTFAEEVNYSEKTQNLRQVYL